MKKLDAVDIFFVILGVLILALAAAFSAHGHVAVLGILAVSVSTRFIEVFPIPLAAALGLRGQGL